MNLYRIPLRRVWLYAGTMVAVLGLLAVAAWRQSISPNQKDPVRLTVAAAASFRDVLPKLASAFTAESGIGVDPFYAASGSIVRQIQSGAPVDLFLSADTASAARARTAAAEPVTVFARGRLAVWWRDAGSPAPAGLPDLTGPRFRKLGIANPELAPYGRAARAALDAAGLGAQLGPRLVIGENVGQVMTWAEQGEVDAAFVPVALALAAKQPGRWFELPLADPAVLDQAFIIPAVAPHRAAAGRFAAFLLSPRAQSTLAAAGYLPPAGR